MEKRFLRKKSEKWSVGWKVTNESDDNLYARVKSNKWTRFADVKVEKYFCSDKNWMLEKMRKWREGDENVSVATEKSPKNVESVYANDAT